MENKQEYPKWLFHATKEPVLVNDPAEHKKLGKGWAESPAAFESEPEQTED